MSLLSRKSLFSLIFFAFILALSPFSIAQTNRAPLAKITRLLNQGKYQDAYQLAKRFSRWDAGDLAYDLLLGRSALAVGEDDTAVLAFERVLMEDPSDITARFFLAKSYYKLEMYEGAKTELDLIPSTARASFNSQFSDLEKKVEKGLASGKREYHFYGRLNFGYDNNVNNNTDEDYSRFIELADVNISSYTDAQVADLYNRLSQFNENLKSNYLYPQLGVRGKHQLNSKYQLSWDVNASHKEYFDIGGYDASQGNFTMGLRYSLSPLYTVNGIFYYQEYFLHGKRYRESPIVSLSVSRFLNEHNILKLYTYDGILAYPNNRTSDVNMYVGGLEWAYTDNKNALVTQLFYGQNHPRGIGSSHNSNRYAGIEIAAKRDIFQKLQLVVSTVYQRSYYNDKAFNDTDNDLQLRRDSYRNFSTGLYYRFNPNYTYYVLGTYTNNSSNIFLYRYDRFEFWTGISFSF